MVRDGDGPDSSTDSRTDAAGSEEPPRDVGGSDDEFPVDDATLEGRSGPRRPSETVDELSQEDLTDLDEVEGIQIESPDTPIERGTIDRENAAFVVLGVLISVLVFLEFLSVLPGG